jgi:ankyrin repeat protein
LSVYLHTIEHDVLPQLDSLYVNGKDKQQASPLQELHGEWQDLSLAASEDNVVEFKANLVVLEQHYSNASKDKKEALHKALWKALHLTMAHGTLDCVRAWLSLSSAAELLDVAKQSDAHQRTIVTQLVMDNFDQSDTFLTCFLDNWPKDALSPHAPDMYGRTPLHYAAHHGYTGHTTLLVQHLIKTQEKLHLYDQDGHTPILLAIMGNHSDVLITLLESNLFKHALDHTAPEPIVLPPVTNPIPSTLFSTQSGTIITKRYHHHDRKLSVLSSASYIQDLDWLQPHVYTTALAVACRLGFRNIVRILLDHGADPNHADNDGETPLHLVARNGSLSCVTCLLESAVVQASASEWEMDDLKKPQRIQLDLHVREHFNGWTPLFVAVIGGHAVVVQALLDAGANALQSDNAGWTVYEHACFRGHFTVADMIKQACPQVVQVHNQTSLLSSSPRGTLDDSVLSASPSTDGLAAKLVKRAYGHRYLVDETMLLITLGSVDSRLPYFDQPVQFLESAQELTSRPLSMVLTMRSGDKPIASETIVDLSAVNIHLEPIVMSLPSSVQDVALCFDIVPTFKVDHTQLSLVVGRAVTFMDMAHLKDAVCGRYRHCLPITQDNTIVGKVYFEVVVVRAYQHPKLSIDARKTYWKSVSTKIIGHRGLGANRPTTEANKRLQLSENTLLSFITAANLGAEYVEFGMPFVCVSCV